MKNTAAKNAELAKQWPLFPVYLQRAMRDFARYPYVTGNLNYITGYLGGLRDAQVLSSESYSYALALPAEIQTDADLRHEVLAHAEQTVSLGKVSIAA